MFNLRFVKLIQFRNGGQLPVLECEGLNHTNGVPESYGVVTLDNRKLIIPRESVLWFELAEEAAA